MLLELSETEMGMIISSLDFYMRIHIGQYREILFDLRWYRDCSQLDDFENELQILFMKIRDLVLSDISGYGWSGSYGIFNPDVDYRAGIAYDMMQVFRNKLAYYKHPEGSIFGCCLWSFLVIFGNLSVGNPENENTESE